MQIFDGLRHRYSAEVHKRKRMAADRLYKKTFEKRKRTVYNKLTTCGTYA